MSIGERETDKQRRGGWSRETDNWKQDIKNRCLWASKQERERGRERKKKKEKRVAREE